MQTKKGGARQDPGSEEADERFVASLSTCLEEMDTKAAKAAGDFNAEGAVSGGSAGQHHLSNRLRLSFDQQQHQQWQQAGGRNRVDNHLLRNRDLAGRGRGGEGGLVVLVGTAESLERVPASVRRCFTHEVCSFFSSLLW